MPQITQPFRHKNLGKQSPVGLTGFSVSCQLKISAKVSYDFGIRPK